jgi:predicted dinucleotide-binding enzyme
VVTFVIDVYALVLLVWSWKAERSSKKILLDIANPLDFSQGFLPSLTMYKTDSLGERIQRAFPETRVVKTLNTMNAAVMVSPDIVPGDHTVFLSSNDVAAKEEVMQSPAFNFHIARHRGKSEGKAHVATDR